MQERDLTKEASSVGSSRRSAQRWVLLGAFASLVNGLVEAHLVGLFFGGFLSKYLLTVGLLILAFGLGSLVRLSSRSAPAALIWQQQAVAFAGLIGPLVILSAGSRLPMLAGGFASAAAIFLLGFIGGMEFPIIAELAQFTGGDARADDAGRVAAPERPDGLTFARLLGADYLGMAIAAFAFPVVLVRSLGVLESALFASSINLLISAEVGLRFGSTIDRPQRLRMLGAGLFLLLVLLLGFVAVEPLREMVGTWMTT